MTAYPLPTSAYDDRLGFVGTSGSGKTFAAGTAVERIITDGGRVVIVDPLGVWWGLRLRDDGKTASRFNVVIFGGEHGDLPINEHHGAIIGETVAGIVESCIVDLSKLGTKAAERRFMLGFLTALYRRKPREPMHLVIDEADMFAPQRLLDKEGEAAKLLGMMETVVRRGRIRGFIPWLITQRPAVVSKDVLSQVDGLIIMKLTASQDRDAIGDWVEGQADKAQWKAIWSELPTYQVGAGLVWIPGRGIFASARFPLKVTYDSSRAPKRGEVAPTAALKPLDLPALRDKLAAVEAEAKANDPKALKTEIARLQNELKISRNVSSDPKAIEEAFQLGRVNGFAEALDKSSQRISGVAAAVTKAIESIGDAILPLHEWAADQRAIAEISPTAKKYPVASDDFTRPKASGFPKTLPHVKRSHPTGNGHAEDTAALTGPQRQLLGSLMWWRAMGHDRPTRVQAAVVAGWRVSSGHFRNVLGGLRSAGLVDYPSDGTIALTLDGITAAPEPDVSTPLESRVLGILNGPQRHLFTALPGNGAPATREALAAACGWEATSGHFRNVLGSMRSLEIIDYPQSGTVARAEWIT